ncbi:MurR/RpiR family transcriptional regulator [Corynebacterium sp.]|uniref:MurR/RpiR family transcriptional regulator n=1 Tax=Corynebacterium sp. TaxID=1720 RepID=UPI0028AEB3F5|nr:MurR/RpiR family transcriptional regulator [Corynebacterium sp.]
MTTEKLLAQRAGRTTLGAQSERVVQVLARMPQFASYASAREVAERAGVNVSTVVRTAQQLRFEGWTDLRQAVRNEYLESLSASAPPHGTGSTANADSTDSADSSSRSVASPSDATRALNQDARNLSAVATAENIAAISSIAEAIHAARRTVVLTTGSGAGPAQILSYLGSIYGYDIQAASGPATTQAVAVAQMDERDCLIVINVWRLTRALRGLTKLGHERGAVVSVLTDLRSSPLNDDADHVVLTPIEGVDATPSLTAMVSVVQAILAVLARSSTRSSPAAVEKAWEILGLMDDQS